MFKVIAFDWGNVCGYYNLKCFDDFLEKNHYDCNIEHKYFEQNKGDFDRAKINERQFRTGLKKTLGFNLDRQLLAKNNQKNLIIDLVTLKFIKSLRKKYTIILWSNTDPTSTKQLQNEINLKNYFDQVYFSWQQKTLKSDRIIFDKILKKCSCLPSEILFIDDFIDNIESMKKYGAQGIVYKNLGQLKNEFKKIKVL